MGRCRQPTRLCPDYGRREAEGGAQQRLARGVHSLAGQGVQALQVGGRCLWMRAVSLSVLMGHPSNTLLKRVFVRPLSKNNKVRDLTSDLLQCCIVTSEVHVALWPWGCINRI